MRKNTFIKIFLFFVISISIISCEDEAKPKTEIINFEKWQYKGIDDKWRRAYLPECIQNSLQRDTIIKGIFYRDFFEKIKWTDTVAWQYKGIVNLNEFDKKSKYELNISKIIGIADIYINDSLLFTAENAFISFNYDISDILHKGTNTISIKFKSFDKLKNFYKKQSRFHLPFSGLEYFRLPFYYFDDTTGIALLPTGVKGAIHITKWDKIRIKNVYFQLLNLNDKNATIRATYEIEALASNEFSMQIAYKKKTLYHQKIDLKEGLNSVSITFQINKPQLWWTHDLGTPFLYKIKTSLFKDKNIWAYNETFYGIRQIKIDTTDNNFILFLNGKPLTLKIVDFTANNTLYGINTSNYNIVDYFVKMNANMVHITQYGEYQDNNFYTQCDKAGILVWQDFMTPYKIIPKNENLKNNIEQEAIEQTIKLRNHSCLAFWSGQNNIEQQLLKYKFSTEDSLLIINTNNEIFDELLPKTISKYDSGSYYFDKMNFYSIKKIDNTIPSYPFIVSLRRISKPKDRKPHSKIIVSLSRPFFADSLIQNYMQNEITIPQDITAYLYYSQYLSKKHYQKEIETQRFKNMLNAFECTKIKDYSPAFSVSAIDYYGFWKGTAYAIKNAFNNIIFNIIEKNGWISIFINSDFQENTNADFYFILYNFDGKVLWRKNYLGIQIDKLSDRKYFNFNLSNELNKWGKNFCVFKINMYINKELYAEKYFLFTADKYLKLEKPNIKRNFYKVENGYIIELSTDYFAHGVFLYTDRDGLLEDNFFDIIPGETKKVKFTTNNDIYAIESAFKTIDITDLNNRDLFNLNKK